MDVDVADLDCGTVVVPDFGSGSAMKARGSKNQRVDITPASSVLCHREDVGPVTISEIVLVNALGPQVT